MCSACVCVCVVCVCGVAQVVEGYNTGGGGGGGGGGMKSSYVNDVSNTVVKSC